MGKLTVFEIVLSNQQCVYYPGQMLQGHVIVELSEEMKMRGIRLQFYGGSQVHWTERHSTGSGKNRRTTTRHYSASEQYFNSVLVLFGKAEGQSGDNPVLPAGRYSYQFNFQLPCDIPSSFEGSVGRVRYWLSCVIDKPWKFDHNTKKAFTVINLLDLNTEPTAVQGAQGSGSKTLCCLCCKSGPITCKFTLDKLGYVPGEIIPVRGEIINHSNRRMAKSYAEFIMVTKYHATKKTKTTSQVVARLERGEVDPGDTDVWPDSPIPIPPCPPSKLPGCRIIEIDYYVKLCVDPAGPAFDLEVPLNVIIGSIPLQCTVQQYGMPSAPASSEMYQATAAGDAPALAHPDMPPPTYAECAFGKVNIKDDEDSEYTRGNLEYAPKYTYYNWGNEPQPYVPSVTD
ncbi:arrestin domain-containing protein 17-like [Gigantopelta aegis]|uniref:arrestin domain-containing protein 17-like n=1 Tax=Gigantopelta aegis TaxID=1735272 RepID=UPI001B88B607|nr:arrestin domain-containing protein 17-like [Gigantopelta aegis]XP_041369225.1 arrestin domain-containing protein 17-like [Gigantopelta aegis]